jgi:hypothetical protein
MHESGLASYPITLSSKHGGENTKIMHNSLDFSRTCDETCKEGLRI